MYKNYLSDRSYKNKRNVKKGDKALEHKSRARRVKIMEKVDNDLEDATRRHNTKILHWYVNKLRRNSQSELVPVKDRNEATNKERVKER